MVSESQGQISRNLQTRRNPRQKGSHPVTSNATFRLPVPLRRHGSSPRMVPAPSPCHSAQVSTQSLPCGFSPGPTIKRDPGSLKHRPGCASNGSPANVVIHYKYPLKPASASFPGSPRQRCLAKKAHQRHQHSYSSQF